MGKASSVPLDGKRNGRLCMARGHYADCVFGSVVSTAAYTRGMYNKTKPASQPGQAKQCVPLLLLLLLLLPFRRGPNGVCIHLSIRARLLYRGLKMFGAGPRVYYTCAQREERETDARASRI